MDERRPRDRWRRFTILDASLLTGSIAVGLALAGHPDAARWLAPGLQTAAYLFSGLALGSLIALPAILACQWAFRGRRLRPTAGEILGLAFIATFPIAIVTGNVLDESRLPFLIGMMLLDLFIALAALRRVGIRILDGFLFPEPRPSLCWTDSLGVSACILGGSWLIVSSIGLGEL